MVRDLADKPAGLSEVLQVTGDQDGDDPWPHPHRIVDQNDIGALSFRKDAAIGKPRGLRRCGRSQAPGIGQRQDPIGGQTKCGQDPLNVKRTIIRLSPDIIARIEAIAGKRQMPQFIRETVEAELLRREAGESGRPKPIKPKPRKGDKPRKAP